MQKKGLSYKILKAHFCNTTLLSGSSNFQVCRHWNAFIFKGQLLRSFEVSLAGTKHQPSRHLDNYIPANDIPGYKFRIEINNLFLYNSLSFIVFARVAWNVFHRVKFLSIFVSPLPSPHTPSPSQQTHPSVSRMSPEVTLHLMQWTSSQNYSFSSLVFKHPLLSPLFFFSTRPPILLPLWLHFIYPSFFFLRRIQSAPKHERATYRTLVLFFTFTWLYIATCFFIIKPTRCINCTNLF